MRDQFLEMGRSVLLDPRNIAMILVPTLEGLCFLSLFHHHPAKYNIQFNSSSWTYNLLRLFNHQIKQMRSNMHEESRLWDYEVLQELGKGQYGQVFKVKNKKEGLLYALKKVNISSCHQKEKIQAFRELKALKLIKHPDIIQYYQSFLSLDNIYIIMEYAAKGDFAKIVKERRAKEKPFAEHQLWGIFNTLTTAVRYLHEKGIIHRDLKLQNIFMTEQGKVKVGDLGMCKLMNQKNELISTRVGTPIYFAPEIIQHQLYSYPVDLWALGCVFYYLSTLQHPFKEATIETLSLYVIEKDPKPIKGHYGGYLINFINSLLNKNPKLRLDIFQAGLCIKNRDNPNPPNKVQVFDFKKLLMMKPDLQKLQELKKVYHFQNQKKNVNDSMEVKAGVKNYRDYLKLNLNTKMEDKKQTSESVMQSPRHSHRKRANYSSLSMIAHKKPQDSAVKHFSPIKTNGFGSSKIEEYQIQQKNPQGCYFPIDKSLPRMRQPKRRCIS